MTEKKRFRMEIIEGASLPFIVDNDSAKKQSDKITSYHTYETDKKNKCLELVELLNTLHEENEQLQKENEQLKKELERCKKWINSDKYDYELTLAFIKSKGYSLRDVLEYEKVMRND